MKGQRWRSVVLGMVLVGCGCAGAADHDALGSPTLTESAGDALGTQSEASAREAQPELLSEGEATELMELAEATWKVASALDRELRRQSPPAADRNFVFSPYGIESNLVLLLAGAARETERQMVGALQTIVPASRVSAAWGALDARLPTSSEGLLLERDQALWVQDDVALESGYLQRMALCGQVTLRSLDFWGAPDEARQAINGWLTQVDSRRVPSLVLPEGSVTESTRIVMANRLSFQGRWVTPFPPEATEEGQFISADGTENTVLMMRQTADVLAAEGAWGQAVALPYVGELSLMLVRWAPEGVGSRSAQGEALLRETFRALRPRSATVVVPRFSVEQQLDLSEPLRALGVTDAFDPSRADFSNMDGTRELYLRSVYHGAAVVVDEGGTRADSSTVAVMDKQESSGSSFVFDGPFVFLVVHQPTETVLFWGRVNRLGPA